MRPIRKLEILGDLARLMFRHGGWFTKQATRRLSEIRARGMAQFERKFTIIHHTDLDQRLAHLPVQLGVAQSVDVAKSLIVARFCHLLQPRAVLEIGTFRGGMTATIGANTGADCRIWTLDLPNEEVDERAGEMYSTDVEMGMLANERVGEEWRQGPASDRTTQLWGGRCPDIEWVSQLPIPALFSTECEIAAINCPRSHRDRRSRPIGLPGQCVPAHRKSC